MLNNTQGATNIPTTIDKEIPNTNNIINPMKSNGNRRSAPTNARKAVPFGIYSTWLKNKRLSRP